MKKYIFSFSAVIFILFFLFSLATAQSKKDAVVKSTDYESEKHTKGSGDLVAGAEDKVYTVSELINSGLPENTLVKVKGIAGNCVTLKISIDYEGPGSGCSLEDPDGKHFLQIGDFGLLLCQGKEVVVSGHVSYCGGKKISEYICSLRNTTIVTVCSSPDSTGFKAGNPAALSP